MKTPARRPKILALILAGGEGGRLGPLTDDRAKPTVPFAGTHRLIDFALSNCLHSGLRDVWIIEQSELHTLNDHLANGRPWDLDRTFGGLQIIPPSAEKSGGDDQGGFAHGNADALWRQRDILREFAPDLLLVLSADHVYRCDFRDVIDAHAARGYPDLTLVTTSVPPGDDARRFSLVQVKGGASDGRVTDFAYKPEQPAGDTVATEIFLFSFPRLMETLENLAATGEGLKDYGDALLPRLVADGRVFAHPLGSYWRDVGTLPSLWRAHRDLLLPEPPMDVDDPAWPILSAGRPRLPARVHGAGAAVGDSLLSPGCEVRGRVTNSILGPGVFIGAGAEVADALLFGDVRVEAGASVRGAIVDEHAVIGPAAQVGGDGSRLTVVKRGENVPAGAHVGPEEDAPEIG